MLSHMPIHAFTGLQALDVTRKGRPIWPVMGGSQPHGDPQGNPPAPTPTPGNPPQPQPPAPPAPQPQPDPQQQPPADRGYPENTPLAQMTVEQREAYWKHHARRHESRSEDYSKLGTPDELKAALQRLQELEDADLGDAQKAAKDAAKQAAQQAKTETEAVWKPKYQTAMLRAIASPILQGDQDRLNAFLAITDPAKFAGSDGEIDEDLVMGHLTALYGQQPPPAANGRQPQPNWGQHGWGPPNHQPGEGGRAEAEKRRQARQKQSQ